MLKEIVTVPDEILKKISDPIEKVGINEKKLIDDLFETMYHSKGIGLAAVQVGILKRVLVVDVSNKDEKNQPIALINPVIKNLSEETSVYERVVYQYLKLLLKLRDQKFVRWNILTKRGRRKILNVMGCYLLVFNMK